jgi:ADP-ribosylglycohydrolase
MFGAILGDIIGSPYEFDLGDKSKEFPLFSKGSQFTDDTVMTVAVAQALLEVGKDASLDDIRQNVVQSMRSWGNRYPYAGYGHRFSNWLDWDEPKPYNSFGNGSAMRVSPCGLIANELSEALSLAKASAEVTHNHPEGIKGAQAVAGAVFLAKQHKEKDEIADFIRTNFYDLDFTLEDIRASYRFNETCQGTVPQAIVAFLESTSFEDAIRNAVSLGGDCDTLTAITGSIAWAYYRPHRNWKSLPEFNHIYTIVKERIPEEFLQIIDVFERVSFSVLDKWYRYDTRIKNCIF